jgi:hypothetical protein
MNHNFTDELLELVVSALALQIMLSATWRLLSASGLKNSEAIPRARYALPLLHHHLPNYGR